MQINSIKRYDNARRQPNFGAIKATNEAKEYIMKNFSDRAVKKLGKLMEQQKNNVHDIKISTHLNATYNGEYLLVEAGDKAFDDQLSLFPIAPIKKAVKYLTKYVQSLPSKEQSSKIINKL